MFIYSITGAKTERYTRPRLSPWQHRREASEGPGVCMPGEYTEPQEPGKATWQIAIEPSAASRAGRTTRAAATGHVRGRVFDEFGASIPDASVSFQPLDPRSGLTPFEAVADSRGRFDFIR